MLKPQERYEEIFNKECYPARAEELRKIVVKGVEEYRTGYLDELIDIIYCCGYLDGFSEAGFFNEKIR